MPNGKMPGGSAAFLSEGCRTGTPRGSRELIPDRVERGRILSPNRGRLTSPERYNLTPYSPGIGDVSNVTLAPDRIARPVVAELMVPSRGQEALAPQVQYCAPVTSEPLVPVPQSVIDQAVLIPTKNFVVAARPGIAVGDNAVTPEELDAASLRWACSMLQSPGWLRSFCGVSFKKVARGQPYITLAATEQAIDQIFEKICGGLPNKQVLHVVFSSVFKEVMSQHTQQAPSFTDFPAFERLTVLVFQKTVGVPICDERLDATSNTLLIGNADAMYQNSPLYTGRQEQESVAVGAAPEASSHISFDASVDGRLPESSVYSPMADAPHQYASRYGSAVVRDTAFNAEDEGIEASNPELSAELHYSVGETSYNQASMNAELLGEPRIGDFDDSRYSGIADDAAEPGFSAAERYEPETAGDVNDRTITQDLGDQCFSAAPQVTAEDVISQEFMEDSSASLLPDEVPMEPVQAAWNAYFAAFASQDVGRIMLSYTDASQIVLFNESNGTELVFRGLDGVQDCFMELFQSLFNLSDLDVPQIVVEEDPEGMIFFVWRCPASGVSYATDTFVVNGAGQIAKQNIVIHQPNGVVGTQPTTLEPTGGPIQAAWDHYFDMFVAKDLDALLLVYTERSSVKLFNAYSGEYAEYHGINGVADCFQGLFGNLTDLSDLAAPLVRVEEHPQGMAHLIWRCPASGYHYCTDTFIFDADNKIAHQTMVVYYTGPLAADDQPDGATMPVEDAACYQGAPPFDDGGFNGAFGPPAEPGICDPNLPQSLPLGPGDKRLVLFRHGRSLAQDAPSSRLWSHDLLDCGLSEEGWEQCLQLRSELFDDFFDLVVVSPLTKALQTALVVFQDRPVPIVVHPALAGDRGGPPEATARRLIDLQGDSQVKELPRFDEVDFSLLPQDWPEQRTGGGPNALLEWLSDRPETSVAVVGLFGVLRRLMPLVPDIPNCLPKMGVLGKDGTLTLAQ